MKKLSVEEIKSYWEMRIRRAKTNFEGVLWEGLPIWNRYVDMIQTHYLRKYINQIKPTDLVLDLGCGVGRFTFRLAKRCKKVWGIDASPTAIEICKIKCQYMATSNAIFRVMDVRNLEFEDETFDWVFSVTVLQHITNEADLAVAIREVLRVTKSTGKIVLLECTSEKRKDEHVISLPRNKWFKIIEDAGGKIESWHGVDVPLLRSICFPILGLTRRVESSKIKKYIEYGIISLIAPFEYTVPKIAKNQSWYTVMSIVKKRT